MNAVWFESGRRIDSIAVDDRGLQYGDGLFETIAIRNGRPRLWPLHLERLHIGCARLGLTVPEPSALEHDLAVSLADARGFGRGVAKLIVTRGSGGRGYRAEVGAAGRRLIGVFEPVAWPGAHWAQGVDVRLCSTRLSRQPALAGIKSLNRLEQVLARSEWSDDRVPEGIMLDGDEHVVCGTMSNLFCVSDQRLLTPAITTAGVSGVMRRHILALCAEQGLDVAVDAISIGKFLGSDEAFLCNSQVGLWPIRRCDGRRFAAPGPVTARIMALLAAAGISECRA